MPYPGLPDSEGVTVEFDYSVWTEGTEIVMVSVPWDNSYRDVVRFDSEDARNSYFTGLANQANAITLDHMVYLRYGEPVRVPTPFSAVNRCNYLIVHNPVQPIPSHGGLRSADVFYYFINDVRYVAPNTTELIIQLDVWQTYYNRVTFNLCYIERGHVGIANENSTIANLSAYLTEPEGLEVGNEYAITHQDWHGFQEDDSVILILSTADLSGDLGSISKPNLDTATGDAIDGLISGCNGYFVEGSKFGAIMKSLSQYPWAAQCITLITAVPFAFARQGDATNIAGIAVHKINPDHPSFLDQWSFDGVIDGVGIPSRYNQLLKFYTSPYSMIELTNFTGSPLAIKPETLSYQNGSVAMYVMGSYLPSDPRFYCYPLGVNQSTANTPYKYKTVSGRNGNPTELSGIINGGEFLDCAIVYDNFPQFSIVNNSYMTYLASTANTRAYQYQAADWSQQKALTGAQLSYDQANAATNNMLQNAQLGIGAAWDQNEIANQQALVGGITGAIGGIGSAATGNLGGGVAQAAGAIANAALSTNWNNQRTAISTGLAAATSRNNARLADYNRDTNYDYAQFAAKGDYANAIGAIQAKVDDARLIQPSVSGQNGGQTANYACGLFGCLLRVKRLKDHFMNQIGEYWLRYGYAVSRWIVPPANLKCMTKVTYWKMQNCMIQAQIPEAHKNAIRGIFESGVSVWNNPAEINNIDLGQNRTVAGVRY